MSKEARPVPLLLVVLALSSLGAQFRTTNFVIRAKSPELAREIGEEAERLRRELAVSWTGKEFPNWAHPCPVTVKAGDRLGAGGATSFVFDRGQVFDWTMDIQGSRERILDSVLPHEITHTILATHFRRRLPRWLDEGACTTVEHHSEKTRHQHMLVQFLKSGRGIPFNEMFHMMEYPRDILPLYAQGFSLARYLIEQKGRRYFVQFVEAGLKRRNWTDVVQEYYGHPNLAQLQNEWLDWVTRGGPLLDTPGGTDEKSREIILASNSESQQRPAQGVIYRGQSEDPPQVRPSGPISSSSGDRLVPVPPRRDRGKAVQQAASEVEQTPQTQGGVHGSGSFYRQFAKRRVLLQWSRNDESAKNE